MTNKSLYKTNGPRIPRNGTVEIAEIAHQRNDDVVRGWPHVLIIGYIVRLIVKLTVDLAELLFLLLSRDRGL